MNNLKELVEKLNYMILHGQVMEAFEELYDEEIIMQENENPPFIGKSLNREREKEFFAKIIEFRSAEVKAVAVGDNITMVEWFFDYTHKDWGIVKHHQVSVQRWKDGKIIRENFYYGT